MIQYLITALIDFAVGVLSLSKRDNLAARALGYTTISLGFWSLELYFLTAIDDLELMAVLFHLSRWGMFIAPAAFALLAWRLVGSRSKLFKWAVLAPSFVTCCALCLGNFFFFPSVLAETEGGYLPAVDVVYYAFGVHFLWCFIGSLVLVTASYKSSSSREKQRLKWLLITLFFCFFGGGLLIFVMPSDVYLSKFVGPISNIVFVAFLFYSTIQHHLMDFKLALTVGLSRAILLGFFVWLYFLFTSVVGEHSDSSGNALILLVFVVLILEAYPRLLKWILPSAKKFLVADSYDYDKVKTKIENAMNHAMNFSDMLDAMDRLFFDFIRVEKYEVLVVRADQDSGVRGYRNQEQGSVTFIDSDNKLFVYCLEQRGLVMADEAPENIRREMEAMNAALCFTISFSDESLGLVAVGLTTDVSYYRYDDIRMFEWLKKRLGQVVSRLTWLDHMQDQLGEAKKTLSMLGMMNHYHHDIKAPFAIIDGVLSNDIYDREKQKNIVLEQVERGSKLIATMAGILRGKRKRRLQSCALEGLIQDCLFVFEQGVDGVELDLNGIPNITGDAEDLKILFINLIKNAVEARQGYDEMILSISTWVEDESICVSIGDNGVGMSEAQVASLWEQSFSAKDFGSGIGMQAIKRIADEHSAKVEVKSEPQKGSIFTLKFPMALVVKEPKEGDITVDELAEKRATYSAEAGGA